MRQFKRALITGGAGFIGSHLVDFLLKNSFSVDVVDDLSNGSLQNISHVLDHEGFYLHEVSLSDWLNSSESDQTFDLVFHLASPVGVSLVEQLSEREFNALESVNRKLIDRAFQKTEKLCLTSSSEVYGDLGDQLDKVTMGEESALDEFPEGKRWRYAKLKRKMERYALQVFKNRRSDLFIGRLFNVVGERQSPEQGMVLPTFVKAVRENEKISIFGDGTQQRCFSDVKDVVQILVNGVTSKKSPAVVNIGNESSLTLEYLARKVNEIGSELGFSSSEITFQENRTDEVFRRIPDTRRLQKWLGEAPEIEVESVIRRVFDHQIRQMENKNGEVLA